MLLTLLGNRNFSKLVPYMTDGVDVTNSAWEPNFLRLGDDNVTLKGSMLLTLLGVRLF
jgi:hypothetical protein